jgi:hypothetical protein
MRDVGCRIVKQLHDSWLFRRNWVSSYAGKDSDGQEEWSDWLKMGKLANRGVMTVEIKKEVTSYSKNNNIMPYS